MEGVPITTLIVDDEFQGRNLLTKLIAQIDESNIQIIGEAKDVQEAYEIISEKRPQLVFLDIMMPRETGFGLLEKFDKIDFEVIFTTAHNEFAVKAFKYNALEYLLKPIDIDELAAAIQKVKSKISFKKNTSVEQLQTLFRAIKSPQEKPDKIAIPTSDGFIFIPIEEIYYCKSNGNYTQFFLTEKRTITSSYTLKQYDEILSERNFFRVHKSFLINLRHIAKYKRSGTVVMSDGYEIEIARHNREAFIKMFKNKLSN